MIFEGPFQIILWLMLNSSFQVLKMSILKIHAREIFDSRGNPTVEVDLFTNKGESLAVDVYSFLLSDKTEETVRSIRTVLL